MAFAFRFTVSDPKARRYSASPAQVTPEELIRLRHVSAYLPLHSKIAARFGGDYLSAFKGRGMEFDESRPYQAGDDVRNLDWRVMARTGKAHTKLFREERERPVYLAVDCRQAMFFATRGVFKSVIAAVTAAIVGWSAHRRGDRVGGLILSDDEHREFEPGRGKGPLLHFFSALAKRSSRMPGQKRAQSEKTLAQGLMRLRRVARPGSLAVLISDFRGLDDSAWCHLARLTRHNEVIMLAISDPLERRLPAPGSYRVVAGDQQFTLNTFDRAAVDAYQRRSLARRQELRAKARQYGIVLLECSTDDDPLSVLRAGLY